MPPNRLRDVFADTRPLRQPHFRRLWVAHAVTMIGAQLTVVTVPAQLWNLTRDSAMVGLTGLFGLVPLIVFGLWGGAVADLHDRRRVLAISTWGLIVTGVLFFLQASLQINNPWVILSIFAAQQAFFGVSSPARNAILPSVVPSDQLPAAQALNMLLFTFGGIAGPLIGGMLLPVLGFSWLYLIDAICLFATIYAVLKLPPIPPTGDVPHAKIKAIWEGLVYLKGHHVLALSLLVDVIAMVFGMPRVLFPQLANVNFGGPSSGGMELALLFAAIPLGGLLGGLFSGWLSRVSQQGRVVMISIGLWGLGIAVAGLSAHVAASARMWFLALTCAALVGAGAADMISAALRQTILLQAATNDVLGRLQSLFFVIVVGGPRVADILHGWAANYFSPGLVTLSGGLLVVLGMMVCWKFGPSFRDYQSPSTDKAAVQV